MLFLFAFTLFVSATLLFLVQPMVGKMVLPSLGGSAAVWNTCMVFFQAMLLAGYAYTHTVSRWHSRRRQLVTQFAILALPLLVLPFSLGSWVPPTNDDPVLSLLWLLLGMVGIPFFVVATSAPLLQRWFSTTRHPAAKDPYFLYGASNLGSMLALALYPVVIEPRFALDEQTMLWTMGYGVLVLLVMACGFMVWKQVEEGQGSVAPALVEGTLALASPPPSGLGTAITASRRMGRRHTLAPASMRPLTAWAGKAADPVLDKMTVGRRLRWIGLAAAPTSLMLGVTTYLTTDIAAIPFIWIIPLALYLLTFILVFARWPILWVGLPHTVLLYIQPLFLLPLVLNMTGLWPVRFPYDFCLHLGVFFTTALVCHGELAKDRPSARHLTDFYLCMSVGGVLGGIFNALVAPQLFWFGVAEYYLAMVLASCLRSDYYGVVNWIVGKTQGHTPLIPGDSSEEESTPLGWFLDLAIPAAFGFLAYFFTGLGFWRILGSPVYSRLTVLLLLWVLAGRSLRFGLSLACLILALEVHNHRQDPFLFEDRSFFGFVKVRENPVTADGVTNIYHTLVHGGINHGSEIVKPESRRRETITYFHPTGGIGQLFKKFSWPDARLPASLIGLGAVPGGILAGIHSEPPFAVIGLGTGILAAHAKPWQHVVFYEIDPLVKRLSLPPDGQEPYFYYVHDAVARGANLEIILGDGRLTLQKDPNPNPRDSQIRRKLDNYYHIIVIDAFSSDAIPVHLLTAEAIDLYLDRLVPGGVLVFNVTNRYLDLPPVLGKIAEEKDLTCRYYGDRSYEVTIENGVRKEGAEIPDKFGSDWVVIQRKDYAKGRRTFSGGPPLDERVNMELWEPATVLDGPMWTDKYSNLLRVMVWK